MKCDFCKRDENGIKDIFSPIFAKFNEKMKYLDDNIQNKRQRYAQENGFIKENFDKVDKIDEFILNMKIRNIISELANFLDHDQNIKYLSDYFTKHKPVISDEKTLRDLLVLYKKEPTEERLRNSVSELSTKKNDLIKIYNDIKSKIDKFGEVEVDFNIPLNIFDFKDESILYILDEIKNNSEKNKMHLCPCCAYLFKDFSKEIHRAREASRKVTTSVTCESNDNTSFRDCGF